MKGNQEPMLYTTNATVAALNHVPGFDPLNFPQDRGGCDAP